MKEATFNKWFSVFILAGMSIALIITTITKLGSASADKSLILISAFGSLMGVLAAVFSANGRIMTFLFGLIDVSIYGVMCLVNWKSGYSGLGNAMLHFLYFVPMQFIGFSQWRKHGEKGNGNLKARRLESRQWLILAAIITISSTVLYLVLSRFDKSAAQNFLKVSVILDVIPLVCNVAGQFLMSTVYMEQWIFWICVNISSILMWSYTMAGNPDSFASIYIVKYSFYLLNSINGLRIWIKLSRERQI